MKLVNLKNLIKDESGATAIEYGLIAALVSVAAIAALAVGWLAKRQIGGLTGDVLGTTQQVTEAAALLCVAVVI